MICSIIITSRKRFSRLLECVKAIVASEPVLIDYEIIVRLHRDDHESITRIPELLETRNLRVVIGDPLCGYDCVSTFFNEAASLALGDWLWIICDDVIVSGPWMEFLLQEQRRNIILQPNIHQLGMSGYIKDASCPFFFIRRNVWEHEFKREFGVPLDAFVFTELRKNRYWETVFMPGVKAWHQQDEPEALEKYHKT